MNIELCPLCDGCTLCSNVCPKAAITMKPNSKGFYAAMIDPACCVKCGKCMMICRQKAQDGNLPVEIWAAKVYSNDTLMRSSSGGVFTVLSDYVLDHDGVVYGVIFNSDFRIVHSRATSKEERNMMRGSKYVQSDLGNIFDLVYQDLVSGKKVLFSGTPCQIDGLNIYLAQKRADVSELLTCELICNGVSSPDLWERYINEYLKKDSISSVSFRYKHPAIKGSIFAVKKKNGFLDVSGYYSRLYTDKACMNDSCYSCRYTKAERHADLSIGDLQGRIYNAVTLDPQYGCSVVLVNTAKGLSVWERLKGTLYSEQLDNTYEQERLTKPCQAPGHREQFWQDSQTLSMRALLKKYAEKSLLEDLRSIKQAVKIR